MSSQPTKTRHNTSFVLLSSTAASTPRCGCCSITVHWRQNEWNHATTLPSATHPFHQPTRPRAPPFGPSALMTNTPRATPKTWHTSHTRYSHSVAGSVGHRHPARCHRHYHGNYLPPQSGIVMPTGRHGPGPVGPAGPSRLTSKAQNPSCNCRGCTARWRTLLTPCHRVEPPPKVHSAAMQIPVAKPEHCHQEIRSTATGGNGPADADTTRRWPWRGEWECGERGGWRQSGFPCVA